MKKSSFKAQNAKRTFYGTVLIVFLINSIFSPDEIQTTYLVVVVEV